MGGPLFIIHFRLGFSIIIHLFWGTSISGNHHICGLQGLLESVASKKCCSVLAAWHLCVCQSPLQTSHPHLVLATSFKPPEKMGLSEHDVPPNLTLNHHVPYWNRHPGGYPNSTHHSNHSREVPIQHTFDWSKTPCKTSQSVVIKRVPPKSGNMWVWLKISQDPLFLIIHFQRHPNIMWSWLRVPLHSILDD